MIATLRIEMKIKCVLCNTIREFSVMLQEIRNKVKIDKYVIEVKKEITDQQYKKE